MLRAKRNNFGKQNKPEFQKQKKTKRETTIIRLSLVPLKPQDS